MGSARRGRGEAWLAAGLALATFAVFSPVLRNGFVLYDDPNQITGNPALRAGLGAEGVRWAFTTLEFANWHPLTWLAHLAVFEIFGPEAAGFHLASLLLHAATAALLFTFLAGATGRRAPALFAAALFALHPLRVESVAWAAELKDPLSGLFVALALLAHRRYAARPTPARYLAVLAACGCALMAKPTAVTLPVLLLVLDWWPLGRLGGGAGAVSRRRAARVLLEKLPVAALAAGAAALVFRAQDLAGAVRSYEHPAWVRLANAAVALAAYLGKTLWPAGLSYFYPHPGSAIAPGAVGVAVALLAAISALAWRWRLTRPYLAAGWLWCLVAVAPMSGVVQAGFQAMADRYTYLPLVGVAVVAGQALADPALAPRVAAAARVAAATLLLAAGVALTPLQAARWHDSRTLFAHALALDPDNWNAHLKLGELARAEGELDAAATHLRRAVELRAEDIHARTLLGLTLGELGRRDEALAELREALRRNRWWADAWLYLGVTLMRAGAFDEAEAAFNREAALRREGPRALPYLGYLLLRRGDAAGAARHAAALLAREPSSATAHLLDAMVREVGGDRAGAAGAYRRALALDPAAPGAREALGRLEGATPP